jgi:hypothetical protein
MIYFICHGFRMVGFVLISALFQACSVHDVTVDEGGMLDGYPSICHCGMDIGC